MKRLCIFLCVLFTLTGCGKDPAEDALASDGTIHAVVTLADETMDQLLAHVEGNGSIYTDEETILWCDSALGELSAGRGEIDAVSDAEGTEAYRTAAGTYITNVETALQCIRDYLNTGEGTHLETVSGCFVAHDLYRISVDTARRDYFAQKGLDPDEMTGT